MAPGKRPGWVVSSDSERKNVATTIAATPANKAISVPASGGRGRASKNAGFQAKFLAWLAGGADPGRPGKPGRITFLVARR